MIQKLSSVKVHTPNTYDEDGYPVDGGLMDPRLGVIDPGIRCKTCGGGLGECQGHFGHIELTRPVIHVGYAREVYLLLRATCRSCSRLLIPDEKLKAYNLEEMGDEEFTKVWNKSIKFTDSEDKCPYCGETQVKIKFVRPYSYYEGENNLLVTDIRERFESITDQGLAYLGLKVRPEWMILPIIPVLPITIRPSITLESSDRSEDDLTHKLVDILRINQRLEENINSGAPQLIIEDLWDLLQYHIATYFDNGITGIPPARHRSGRPLKTIAQRLKGKEGRFRKNLSGKRVNFSARTVISPDPNLSINEVAVPELIALELTVPEEVNERNIDELKKRVLNGPKKHPGVHNVITPYGRKRMLEENKKDISETLNIGDVVERHIQDGDTVIFNRQPSLHRNSMMCHTVRVLPHNTLRLNAAVCAPYNADFDGDEMNLHVPQSQEAIAEAEVLMKVQECIISPRFSMPIIGGEHDHVSGMYLVTIKSSEFTREEALDLIKGTVKLPPGKKKFTGKEIFSLLLPEDFNLSYKGKLCEGCKTCKKEKCNVEAYVTIKNGKLITGIIEKEGMKGPLLNELFTKYGSDAAREYIDKSTRLATMGMMHFGFSVGIDEEDLPKNALTKIDDIVDHAEKEVDRLIKLYNKGNIKMIPGKSAKESLEDHIMGELGNARDGAGKIAEKFTEGNSAVIMAKTGARGTLLNLTQMAGMVGQQAVRGKRIDRGYHDRTLSHFEQGDLSAEASGFVGSSFKRGLSPTEYFFHSMGGREGLVDTAIRTGRSGYMQRRLINALQDLKVHADKSVRGDGGILVQFTYGEDGIDPVKKYYARMNSEELSTNVKGKMDGMNKKERDNFLPNYEKALVTPGEAVGTVAAQSIGEPGTQMTLRTFHYAGVAELSVPLGLPRLIEIIDAKRTPKNSITIIFIEEKHSKDKKFVDDIANTLRETFLPDVCDIDIDVKNKELVIKTSDGEAKKILEKLTEEKMKGSRLVIKKKSLSDLKKLKDKLDKKRLGGIKSVNRVFVRQLNGEYVIYTEGSNLKGFLGIKGVDGRRTTTNDILQIYETLGIEAARNAIIKEALEVLKDQNLDVDIRHIMLVADQMTVGGEVQAVGRQGISGTKESVLARAAFEETEKHILNAALYGEVDLLEGVAENIIVGQPIPIGTGTVELAVKSQGKKK
ncbi:MAG: DNA-directed RNA polymerase subunit A' [Candidatus Altiarchaeales archaeon]|nr:DNA-directed RNA polymerase subunit A' [Candidatus Altiarchaeales archaeon]